MKKEFSKSEAKDKISNFFSKPSFSKEEVKKIKRLAMKYNIKLGDKRKLFCKKCFSPYVRSSIILKKGYLTIKCEHCNHKNRWKMDREIELDIEHQESGCC